MGLNLDALKGMQQEMDKGSTDGKYFQQKEIGAETDIRIMPPTEEMGGVFFQKKIVYWINGKPYISPETFGEECPIALEVEEARKQNDPQLNKLLDSKLFTKKTSYVYPMLLLDNVVLDKDGKLKSYTIKDNRVKVGECGNQLIRAIIDISVKRPYQNGTENGFLDRELGFNLMLSKTGKDLNTKYSADAHRFPHEMDEKWYKDVPNVVEEVRNGIYPNDYLQSVIGNFLYGEELMEKPKRAKKEEVEEKPKRRNAEPPQEEVSESKDAKGRAFVDEPAEKSTDKPKRRLLDMIE